MSGIFWIGKTNQLYLVTDRIYAFQFRSTVDLSPDRLSEQAESGCAPAEITSREKHFETLNNSSGVIW